MGRERVKKSAFKWNISHLCGEIADQLIHMWTTLPPESPFFSKLTKVIRLYWVLSIQIAKAYRKEELDLRTKLKIAITNLHEDVYNVSKHEHV